MSDTNMMTILEWARKFAWIQELDQKNRDNTDSLLGLVEIIESCVAFEFRSDIGTVEEMLQRKLTSSEIENFRHPMFSEYSDYRKQRFEDCVKDKLRGVQGSHVTALLNLAYRLWSGCTVGAKMISEKTKDGVNTVTIRKEQSELIDKFAAGDSIFALGVSISPYYRNNRGQSVSLEGLPQNFIDKFFKRWIDKIAEERKALIKSESISESNNTSDK